MPVDDVRRSTGYKAVANSGAYGFTRCGLLGASGRAAAGQKRPRSSTEMACAHIRKIPSDV